MKTLPKYFIIKRNANNPLWNKYIKWFNETYNQDWEGDFDCFYGYDGDPDYPKGVCTSLRKFWNNPVILTLEQWNEIVNKFKLPKAWYVKVTEDNTEILSKWRFDNNHSKLPIGWIVGLYEWPGGRICKEHNPTVNEGWKNEITFEQFKKYVLKENVMKKKLIGYKLKDQNLQRAASVIANGRQTEMNFVNGINISIDNSHCVDKLKGANVLDLWFEPVYKEDDYKVGDWITIEDSSKLETGCCGCPEGTYKIILEESTHGLSKGDYGFNIQTNNKVWRISSEGIRKATLEEIKVATEIELKLSTITLKYKEGHKSLYCRHGVISFKEVEDLFDRINSIIGYDVMGYGLNIEAFSIGCVKLTYEDLKKVWDFVQEKS